MGALLLKLEGWNSLIANHIITMIIRDINLLTYSICILLWYFLKQGKEVFMMKYITHTFLVAPPDFTGNTLVKCIVHFCSKIFQWTVKFLKMSGICLSFFYTTSKEVFTKYLLKRGISSKCGSAVILWMELGVDPPTLKFLDSISRRKSNFSSVLCFLIHNQQ